MGPSISLAYWLMPEELIYPVALMLGVTGFFLRLVGLRGIGTSMLLAAIGMAMLPVLLGPLLEEILMQVPIWVVVAFFVALGLYFVRLVLTLFLGKEGAGTLLAMAVAGSVRKMGVLPRLITRWTYGLGALLHSPNPGRRVLGIALASMLAMLVGLTGRHLNDNGLLPWNTSMGNSITQIAPFQFSSTTHKINEGQRDYR